RDLPEQYIQEIREMQQELGILISPTEFRFVEKEYPEVSARTARNSAIVSIPPNPRNKPCPCGSGKKYKKCHGK
ncbi:MAG: SEC-C metal-binding domain-containing protein, partial [Blastocatellia bacterium]